MKKLVIILLFLAGVAFVGKIILEKRYESKLDDVIALTRGAFDLSYKSVSVDFNGSISINGLRFSLPGQDESVDVESITAISSDAFFLFKGAGVFAKKQFPEKFQLDIRHLSIPVEMYEHSFAGYFESLSDDEECRSLVTLLNYSNAGYSLIEGDVRMAFDFRDLTHSVVSYDAFDQTSSFEFKWVFDANKVASLMERQTTELPVNEISMTFELEVDASERFVAHCADVFRVTQEVYLEKVVRSPTFSKNSFGADLGPEMRQALVAFMKGASQLKINSKPSIQLKKLDQLSFYNARDILRWMNLSVQLNGEPVLLDASTFELSDSVINENKSAASESVEENVSHWPTFTVVPAADASLYLNRWVCIKRSGERKPLEGRLIGLDYNGRLEIKMRRYGGQMTLTAGVDEIELFEVRDK